MSYFKSTLESNPNDALNIASSHETWVSTTY